MSVHAFASGGAPGMFIPPLYGASHPAARLPYSPCAWHRRCVRGIEQRAVVARKSAAAQQQRPADKYRHAGWCCCGTCCRWCTNEAGRLGGGERSLPTIFHWLSSPLCPAAGGGAGAGAPRARTGRLSASGRCCSPPQSPTWCHRVLCHGCWKIKSSHTMTWLSGMAMACWIAVLAVSRSHYSCRIPLAGNLLSSYWEWSGGMHIRLVASAIRLQWEIQRWAS